MKMITKSASIVAALVCTTLLASGCGNSATATKTNGVNGAVGSIGASSGVITPLANGTGQIMFQGTNVFANGGFVATTSNYGISPAMGNYSDFLIPGTQNTLGIGSSNAPGASIALTGSSSTYTGTTINMMTSTLNGATANIGGVIYLSQPAMQALSPSGTTMTVLGLALDLYNNGGSISGSAYICTYRDAGTGICHGAYIPF